jgi:hypothetical protein
LSEAESRSALVERALVCGRLIFGWHFPFRVARLRDARARGGKLSAQAVLGPLRLAATGGAKVRRCTCAGLLPAWSDQQRPLSWPM